MFELEIIQVRNELGLIMSKDVIEQLQVQSVEKLCLILSESGYQITKQDLGTVEQIQQAESISKRYINVLRQFTD